MTFEDFKKQQGTEFPFYVITPSDQWSTHEVTWNEARKTDPVKQQMLEALKVAKADMEEYHQSIGYDEDCEPYNIVCDAIKAAAAEAEGDEDDIC